MIEVVYYFPFVYMQVVSALERMDPTLEESARIAGAKQLYVIRKITPAPDHTGHFLGRTAGSHYLPVQLRYPLPCWASPRTFSRCPP